VRDEEGTGKPALGRIQPKGQMNKLLPFILTLLTATAFGQNTFEVGLTWTPNSEPDITKYRVYRGDGPGVYNWHQDVGLETTVSVGNLLPGRTYVFAVTAWADFLESDKSNEVSYTTPDALPVTEPTNLKIIRSLADLTITWDLPPTNQFVKRWHVSYAIKNKGPQPSIIVTEPKVVIITTNKVDVYDVFLVAEGILGKSPAAYIQVPGIPPAPIGLEIVPGSLKVVYSSSAISQ